MEPILMIENGVVDVGYTNFIKSFYPVGLKFEIKNLYNFCLLFSFGKQLVK